MGLVRCIGVIQRSQRSAFGVPGESACVGFVALPLAVIPHSSLLLM
jgi:hypothetical protein